MAGRPRPNVQPAADAATDSEESAVAARLGLSVLSLRLWCAAGAPGPRTYVPPAKTLAQVAAFFGVSERTVAGWRAKGMPGTPGDYPLPAILEWRRDQPEPEDWHETGNRNLQRRPATGDLARAVFRMLRVHLPEAAAIAGDEFMAAAFKKLPAEAAETIRFAFAAACEKQLSQFRLSEEQIERVLEDCWRIV